MRAKRAILCLACVGVPGVAIRSRDVYADLDAAAGNESNAGDQFLVSKAGTASSSFDWSVLDEEDEEPPLSLLQAMADEAPELEDRYRGYTAFLIKPTTWGEVEVLKRVEKRSDVDCWTDDFGPDVEVELMVAPQVKDDVFAELRAGGMEPAVVVRDVEDLLIGERDDMSKVPKNSVIGRYLTIQEIFDWTDGLPDAHSYVTVKSLGRSYGRAPIKMICVNCNSDLPILLFDGGMHAREWVGVATMVWLVQNLLTSTDPAIVKMREAFEWHIVPVVNPDGYKYAHEHERLWRKNRRPHSRTGWFNKCVGTDLNRNWDWNWAKEGVSSDQCSDIYPGSKAFSEPESKALARHFRKFRSKDPTQFDSRIKAYISFHAFTQLWLVPPGSGAKPPDYDRLMRVGTAAAARVTAKSHTEYRAGAPPDILYGASGGSFDWVHNVVGVRYTYTPELRPGFDRMGVGFNLPQSELIPTAEEAWEGVKYVVQVVAGESGISLPSA